MLDRTTYLLAVKSEPSGFLFVMDGAALHSIEARGMQTTSNMSK